MVELIARKCLGRLGTGGTDLEALLVCALKFGKYSKIIHISVGIFVDQLSNQNPPGASYRTFMSGCLIMIDKRTGVRPFGVKETWQHIFAKFVLMVTGSKATHVCQDD